MQSISNKDGDLAVNIYEELSNTRHELWAANKEIGELRAKVWRLSYAIKEINLNTEVVNHIINTVELK